MGRVDDGERTRACRPPGMKCLPSPSAGRTTSQALSRRVRGGGTSLLTAADGGRRVVAWDLPIGPERWELKTEVFGEG